MRNPDNSLTISAETVEAYLSGIEHLAKIVSELNCEGESPIAEAKDVTRRGEPQASAAKDFAPRNESIAEGAKELALQIEAHQERAAADNRQAETLRRNANRIFA